MPQDNIKTIDVKPSGVFQENIPVIPEDSAFDRTLRIRDLLGLIPTMTIAPTHIPKKFSEQIVIAVAGGNNSLYIYDITNNLWRAATLGT